jgi:cbb3-type cytochrome oxidase maturation protein
VYRGNSFVSQMSVIILLISVSLLVAIGFLVSFLWAVRAGQYEDDYTPSVRMLFENDPDKKDASKQEQTEKTNTVKSI